MKHVNKYFPVWLACCVLAGVGFACSTPMRMLGLETAVVLPGTPTIQIVTVAPQDAGATSMPPETGASPTPPAAETPSEPTGQQRQAFQVSSVVVKEEGQEPAPFILDLEYPSFSGEPAGAAASLNQHVLEVVSRQRAGFTEVVNTPTPPEFMVGPHGFYMRYEMLQNDGRFTSIYFQLSLYSSGAAHPLPYSETLNFEVDTGRVLQLGDLFQPGVDYLSVLSEKSIASLHSRDITGGESGADPLPENYRNWNLSPEGLVIVFDPYQVASYAQGFITVVIPWSELGDILAISFTAF